MQMSGSRVIRTDRATVWRRITDPAILGAAIPGCEEMTGGPETGYTAVLRYKLGPLRATFHGTVRIDEADPPRSYRISGEGRGGLAGFAKGTALIRLDEVPEGTRMVYDLDADLGGRLASIGATLLGRSASDLTDRFFERFCAAIEVG